MLEQKIHIINGFISSQERMRIVRLCATITGNPDVAEDLAQETLLEAWKHSNNLQDTEKQVQWLSGVARNVCMRWARQQGKDQTYLTNAPVHQDTETPEINELFIDTYDLAVELERKELVELLDRAMSLLPEETRAVLIKRYIDESPLADVARQLGTTTGTVAMRIQRGKLALRKVLTRQMQHEIAPYSLVSKDSWEETRIWCTLCGRHRLLGKMQSDEGFLVLHCPHCSLAGNKVYSYSHLPKILGGLKSYKAAITRLVKWSDSYYRQAMEQHKVACVECSKPTTVRTFGPDNLPDVLASSSQYGTQTFCPHCESLCTSYLDHFVLTSPYGQKFTSQHSRVRTIPERIIEVNGRPAAVTRIESMTDGSALDVISSLDTYEIIHVHGGQL